MQGFRVGIAGGHGETATSLLDADIRALLRRGALGSLVGQLELPRDNLRLGRLGIETPLAGEGMGRYALTAASFGEKERVSVGHGSTLSVPRFFSAVEVERASLANGGICSRVLRMACVNLIPLHFP